MHKMFAVNPLATKTQKHDGITRLYIYLLQCMMNRRGYPTYLGYRLTGCESLGKNKGQFRLERKFYLLPTKVKK